MALIQVHDLQKFYYVPVKTSGRLVTFKNLFVQAKTKKVAVSGISFEIRKGEMVGCIGPNGAGKSTMIKMLTGILVSSEGEVFVDGLIPYKQRMHLAQRIGGFFGQKPQLWWDIPVIESLCLPKEIGIYEFQNTPVVRQLSLG